MKRIAYAVVGLALSLSGSGCCGCLQQLFHPYGYGGQCGSCSPCGGAPVGGCSTGGCGYAPVGGVGPMGYAAPIGGTAYMPYGNAPMFAAAMNPNPIQ